MKQDSLCYLIVHNINAAASWACTYMALGSDLVNYPRKQLLYNRNFSLTSASSASPGALGAVPLLDLLCISLETST